MWVMPDMDINEAFELSSQWKLDDLGSNDGWRGNEEEKGKNSKNS